MAMSVSFEHGRMHVEVIPGDASHMTTVRLCGPARIPQAAACAAVADAIHRGGSAFGHEGKDYAEHALNVCLHEDDGEADIALVILDPTCERAIRFRARYRAAVEQLANGEHKWP